MDELEYTPRSAEFASFYPSDQTSGIETFITLYWTCTFAVHYDLYFGTNQDSLELLEENIFDDSGHSEYEISELYLGTTYYWQVIAYNGLDEVEYSPLLSFSTRDGNWGTFYPHDESEDQNLDITFSWSVRQEDLQGDQSKKVTFSEHSATRLADPSMIFYDFYFGTSPDSLEMLSSDLVDEYYQISNLFYGTDYYWQIDARNEISELSPSEIMHFRTRELEWEIREPISGSVINDTTVTLSWLADPEYNNGTSEFSYSVYLGTDQSNLIEIASNINQDSLEIIDLEYRQNYYWQLEATYQELQALTSEVFQFDTRDRFYNRLPQDNELHIDINPMLSWSCTGGTSYDVYAGSMATGMNLIVSGLQDTSYTLYNLDFETVYMWKIAAHLSDGRIWESEAINFITIPDPVPPGYDLHARLIRAEMPCNIDVVYSVTDRANQAVSAFNAEAFQFLEDEEEIDPIESHLQIFSGSEINSTIKTVLMIDNSTSMDTLLSAIKLSAYNFVEEMLPNQEMCVYIFSEQVQLIQDFTDNKASLICAINSISTGYSSTDLYGAVIDGVERWDDLYYPENIIKGHLIIITDGSDTQGSSTLEQALEARGNKWLYTMGIGSNIDTEALNSLGNGGFYQLGEACQAENAFNEILQISSDYLSTLYWLNYITPKRGNVDHTIEVSLLDNPNTGASGIISGNFNSSGFYGTIPGVYVNIDPENGLPYGIEEYTISDSVEHVLTAVTYEPEFEPFYSWVLENPDKIEIILMNNNAHSIVIRRGTELGTTELMVTDTANDHTRMLEIHVER